MPPYNLPPPNLTNGSQGIEAILLYEAGQIDIFMPMLLLFIYVVIATGGYMAQDRKEGRGNLAQWCAIAGLITSVASFILFLYNGLVNIETVVIVVVVTIISVVFFMFSARDF